MKQTKPATSENRSTDTPGNSRSGDSRVQITLQDPAGARSVTTAVNRLRDASGNGQSRTVGHRLPDEDSSSDGNNQPEEPNDRLSGDTINRSTTFQDQPYPEETLLNTPDDRQPLIPRKSNLDSPPSLSSFRTPIPPGLPTTSSNQRPVETTKNIQVKSGNQKESPRNLIAIPTTKVTSAASESSIIDPRIPDPPFISTTSMIALDTLTQPDQPSTSISITTESDASFNGTSRFRPPSHSLVPATSLASITSLTNQDDTRIWIQPTSHISSSAVSVNSEISSGAVSSKRKISEATRDRTQERLNTSLLTAVFDTQPTKDILKMLERGASVDATCRDSGATALHVAALAGQQELAELLVSQGADPMASDWKGLQPVHVAAWEGETDVLKTLLKAAPTAVAAPVKAPTDKNIRPLDAWNHKHDIINRYWHVMEGICEGSTPLHVACRRTKEACVKLLVEAGAPVNVEDGKGLLPMDVICMDVEQDVAKTKSNDASEGSIVGIAKLLISQQRSRPSTPKKEFKLQRITSIDGHRVHQITALHTAVADNNLNLIEILLDDGMDVIAWNEKGQTPLHLAIIKKFEDALALLLRHGDNREMGVVNAVDSMGRSLLHVAAIEEWTDGISLLLEENADIRMATPERENVFHMIATNGNVKILNELLTVPNAKQVINAIDNDCYAPLHKAVHFDHLNCIKTLVEHGANADILLPDGRTLLHMAVRNNSPDLIEYLLISTPIQRLKENKTCKSEGGATALHIAAEMGHTQCVEKLLKFSCDMEARTTDEWGSTPLHLAARRGQDSVIDALLREDIDGKIMEAPDGHGWPPLHVAAGHGHTSAVALMLRAGADLSVVVADEQNYRFTGLDILMTCFHHPVDFLVEILDTYITVDEQIPVTNPKCTIEVDFDLLLPLDENTKQLAVLEAVLNNRNEELQEAVFLHPIVQAFIHLKSKNMLLFFIISFDIFLSLALFLSLVAYHGSFTLKEPFMRYILLILLVINISTEILNVARLQKYYLYDYETWIKWIVFLNVIYILVHPSDYVLRYHMAISILLAWIELLLIIAKYPAWGIYVLMFTTVAFTIIKVLLVFSFLLLGFSFAFRALFNEKEPFKTVWGSLIKVIVMVYELDYRGTMEMMADDEFSQGMARAFYLVFVLLISVSLVNLMLGLAVSDIAELKRRGRAQRLAKRVAFLSSMENLLYGWPLSYSKKVRSLRAAPRNLSIKAKTSFKGQTSSQLPRRLKELLIDKARAIQAARTGPPVCKPLSQTSYF